ncbi:MAG: hypothetical protein IAE91_00950 [Ignavibacteriaceae bacterium]|nr:hypothetical protein [Ignavibacteriaceae bacterium]
MHLNKKIRLTFLFLFAVSIAGCGKEENKGEFLARVNDNYLYESDLNSLIDTAKLTPAVRDELVLKWIRNELLYNSAIAGGIESDPKYLELLEKSKKEIAIALWIQKLYERKPFEVSNKDLMEYYKTHQSSFRLNQTAYLISSVSFSDYNAAITFRNSINNVSWDAAIKTANENKWVVNLTENELNYEFNISGSKLLENVRLLYPGETSFIINVGENYFTVAHLHSKYLPTEIPPFQLIVSKVEETYLNSKRQELFEDYLKSLYSENNFEINNKAKK